MIDLTLKNINRLFVLFQKVDKDPFRDSFNRYFIPLAEIKDFNALIDNTLYIDQTKKQTRSTRKTC